jgi:hypothetical protein
MDVGWSGLPLCAAVDIVNDQGAALGVKGIDR